jgi:hypothetical protein
MRVNYDQRADGVLPPTGGDAVVERIQPHSPGGGFDQTGAQRASVQFDVLLERA